MLQGFRAGAIGSTSHSKLRKVIEKLCGFASRSVSGIPFVYEGQILVTSNIMNRILQTIEADWQSRPTAAEFEMAYQARVASDRIKFAIKHTEQFAPQTDQMREAGLQLLDALQRLEVVDRRFQQRSRIGGAPISDKLASDHAPLNGHDSELSHRVVGK